MDENTILRAIVKLRQLFSIRTQLEEFDTVHSEISKSVSFKGTNLFVLIFAIVVASVGLNMNSTAVIIGAMLISPLMGPINGIGYSLATYDLPLLRRSITNLSLAVAVSLISSAVYFFISPVNEAHSELLARTSPSIYDVIIALFGGLAGIFAMSSKLKGNVIPGVAIATALMPPICTAGYGLATLQFNFFFGALYLFTINTVFIAFAALLVCQYLKFPIRSIIDAAKKKRITQYTTAIIIITIIPSFYFGYRLVKNEEFTQSARQLIREVSILEGNFLQSEKIDIDNHSVELMYSGFGISDKDISTIKRIAQLYKLDSSKVTIKQGFNASTIHENTFKYMSETEMLTSKLNAVSYTLKQAEQRIDSITNISALGQNILAEAQILYPNIVQCVYSEAFIYTQETEIVQVSDKTPIVVLYTTKQGINKDEKEQLVKWLRQRLSNDKVCVVFENYVTIE